MDPVSASTVIDAPRERVYALLSDLSVRPAFCDHMLEEYRLERVDPVGAGAAARFRFGGSGPWMETRIEETDPPHLIRERGSGGRLNRTPSVTVWELVTVAGPSACELTVTFWTEPGHPVDRVREALGGARVLRRGWDRALARLRDLAESGSAPGRISIAGVGGPGLQRLPAAGARAER